MSSKKKGKQSIKSAPIQEPNPQRSSLMQKIAARVPSFSRHTSPQSQVSPTPDTNYQERQKSQVLDNKDGNKQSPRISSVPIPSNQKSQDHDANCSNHTYPNDPNTLFSYPDLESTDMFCGMCRRPSPAAEGTAFRRAASLMRSYSRSSYSRETSPRPQVNTDLQAIRDVTNCATPQNPTSRHGSAREYGYSTMGVSRSSASLPCRPILNRGIPHTSPDRPPTRRRPSLSSKSNEVSSSKNSSFLYQPSCPKYRNVYPLATIPFVR